MLQTGVTVTYLCVITWMVSGGPLLSVRKAKHSVSGKACTSWANTQSFTDMPPAIMGKEPGLPG